MTTREHLDAAQIVRERRARRAVAELNRAYEAASLKAVLADVRRHDPAADVAAAWVYKASTGQWEFHFGDFYWYGSANSATEARAAGWSAWLTMQGAEGYKLAE